jgi:hypothetical protein
MPAADAKAPFLAQVPERIEEKLASRTAAEALPAKAGPGMQQAEALSATAAAARAQAAATARATRAAAFHSAARDIFLHQGASDLFKASEEHIGENMRKANDALMAPSSIVEISEEGRAAAQGKAVQITEQDNGQDHISFQQLTRLIAAFRKEDDAADERKQMEGGIRHLTANNENGLCATLYAKRAAKKQP